MLTFTLKKEWYEKIKRGEKTIEYREVKPYWTKRINKYKDWWSQFLPPKDRSVFCASFPTVFHSRTNPSENAQCLLRCGYHLPCTLANITKIEIVDGKDTDMHIDAPVYAIHLADIKESEE